MKFANRYDRALLTHVPEGLDWVIERVGAPGPSFRPRGALSLRDYEENSDGGVGDWVEKYLLTRRCCPFCVRRTAFCEIDTAAIADKCWQAGRRPQDSTRMERYGDDSIADELARYVYGDAIYQMWACTCGYWQSAYLDFAGGALGGSIVTSKLATFEESLPPGVSLEVAIALQQRRKCLSEISPRLLEQLVAAIFRANYEHTEVRHVGRPGDGGIDVLLVESETSEWLVQVKHHVKSKAAESVTTIRNLLGTLVLEQRTRGVVVSSADHFSYFASKASNQARLLGYEIELVDRQLLARLLERCMSDESWLAPLRQGKLFSFVYEEGVVAIERYLTDHFTKALAPTAQLNLFSP